MKIEIAAAKGKVFVKGSDEEEYKHKDKGRTQCTWIVKHRQPFGIGEILFSDTVDGVGDDETRCRSSQDIG